MPETGEDVMDHDSGFEIAEPELSFGRDGDVRKPVIVLSKWLPGCRAQLKHYVESVFNGSDDPLLMLFVIDDLGGYDDEHQDFLTELIEAGAFVLEPRSDADRDLVRQDPIEFVEKQIALAMQADLAAGTGSPRKPSQPEGYRAFEKAFSRLTQEELADLIQGRHPNDDWRYDI